MAWAMVVSVGERQAVVDLLRSIVLPFPCGVMAWARGERANGRGDLERTLRAGSQMESSNRNLRRAVLRPHALDIFP